MAPTSTTDGGRRPTAIKEGKDVTTQAARILEQAMTPSQGGKMTTRELNELLHAHFIKPDDRIASAGAGAVYLTEVTAPGGDRRADAVHIGLWSSRGAGRIDVCELKVSRADFRRELDKPEKAEAWWPYSTTFSIVAPSVDIAPPEELPPGWGLMVPQARGRRFKVVMKPEERQPELTIPLLITLLKNTETTRTNALQQLRQQLWTENQEREQAIRRERGSYSVKDRRRLEHLDALEKVLGMELGDYPWRGQITPQAAAEGLLAFMRGQAAMEQARERAEGTIRELERAAKNAADQAQALRTAFKSGAV